MKKLISLILALVMVMGLAVTASAKDITITPPNEIPGTDKGITYNAYKIFDATIQDSNVSYTIQSDSAYYTTIVNSGYFKLDTTADGSNTVVVTAKDTYTDETAKTLAGQLSTVAASKIADATTSEKQADNKYTLSLPSDGYYLIVSSAGSALILDTTNTNEIQEKNTYPTLTKKIVDGGEELEFTTADYDETLNFKIAVAIPANAKGEIVVHDDMDGLTYVEMTAQTGVTATISDLGDNCEVHFTIAAATVESNKGNTITIAYTAKMNAEFTAQNKAWLTNNNFTSEEDITSVQTYDIIIDKHVTGSEDTKLAGAKFVLKNAEGKFYKVDSSKNVTWEDPQTEATEVTTNDEGVARFDNLAAGMYDLIETEAPAGYNKLTAPVKVTVPVVKDNSEEKAAVGPAESVTTKVANNTGSELPSTGGMGTTLFYVLGGLMMVGAAVVLVTKKRVA